MIETISEALGGVSTSVVYGLLVLGVIQLTVQIWALVDLVRRDSVAGGRKWVWALVILVLSNLALGAILYFAIGRKVVSVVDEPDLPMTVGTDRATRAVESLYGSGDAGERR